MSQPNDGVWHQLWGTLSVRDHCRRGAFISEVLIYDRLLIPVVATAADLEKEAQATGEKIDARKLAKVEWQRWEEAGWDPARQTLLTSVLRSKDRVDLVPWTFARQSEWRAKMKATFADARRDGYFLTGSILERFAPHMARAVVAVSQYHTLEELRSGEGIRRLEPHEPLASNTLLAVLGHELLVPDDPDHDDFRFLDEALDVASDPKYQACRRNLYEWQQQFVRSDYTDARSIKAAVEKMNDLVHELRTATERQRRWRWSKQLFAFLGVGSKVAAAMPPAAPLFLGGGAVAAIGSFVVDTLTPNASLAAGLPAATLVLDAQSKLGIH